MVSHRRPRIGLGACRWPEGDGRCGSEGAADGLDERIARFGVGQRGQ